MKTFPIGGIHPSDNKQWSKAKAIEVLDLPDQVTIPLAQHIGAPATVRWPRATRCLPVSS